MKTASDRHYLGKTISKGMYVVRLLVVFLVGAAVGYVALKAMGNIAYEVETHVGE